jgi:hypothetical protein
VNSRSLAARAVPDILGESDIIVLACEEYDLDFDPASLSGAQKQAVLAAWRAALDR